MTTRAQFNAEDWSTVTQAPMLAAAAVVAADRGGTMRESMSLARAYADARRATHTELVEAVVGSPPTLDPASLQGTGDVTEWALDRVRTALDVVSREAGSDEADDYRAFVLSLADTVAHAHKEGGVLGIGGKEVSDRERRVLNRLQDALGGPAAG